MPVLPWKTTYVNEIDVNKLARCFYSTQRSSDRNTETGSSGDVTEVLCKKYINLKSFCFASENIFTNIIITHSLTYNLKFIVKFKLFLEMPMWCLQLEISSLANI